VDCILKTKQANAAADTSALEREIDERVYRLYGLTPDEIRLVEESAPSSSCHMASAT
jgi:adenine-specific DNA-methyltransferase